MTGRIAYPGTSPFNQGNVMTRANSISALVGFLAAGLATNAYAQAQPPAETGFWARDTMTGDWSGLRTDLIKQGVTLSLQEQSEAWGNLSGGLRTGAVYAGLTTASMKLDLETIAGWSGTTFTVSVLQIHGRGPTPNLIGSLQAVSGVEATRSTKLDNLWIEKSLLGGDLSIRVGQEGANDEFMLSNSAAVFVNSSFGYPSLMALSLPSGGPNYPLAAPMVRVQYKASDRFTVIGAAFDGDPAGPGTNDPQIRDRTGTAFRLRDGVLAFLELWYSAGSDAQDGRPGTYKIGAWYHSGRFSDPLHDTTGRSLADPASNGIARQYRGDNAVYAVMDQVLWRPNGDKDRGLNVFGLAIAAPDDRNFTSVSLQGGLNWTGPFPERPKDVAGLAIGYANLGSAQRQLGADLVRFGAAAKAFRGHETIIELTYQYMAAPWLILQPDVQYVINPGAGVPSPVANGKSQLLKDAVLAGMRATVTF
jgi:porin